MRKLLSGVFVFFVLCLCSVTVFSESTVIEQVICSRPNIHVYGDFDFADLSQISAAATVGQEKLIFENATSLTGEEGTMYIFLVDCSTSLSKTQTSNIKAALTTFVNTSKMPNDRVCIISFGTQTDVLTDGNGSDADILNAVGQLNNRQDGTVLFDAISKAVELADVSDSSFPQRKVAVIISDADDFNVGGHTLEEINDLVATSSLPFYSLGLNTGSKTGLDTFGRISRASGAKIVVASTGQIQSGLATITDDIKDCDVITFSTPSNIISGKQQLFNLSIFYEGKTHTASRTINDLHWSQDTSAPYVTQYIQIAPNIIQLTFSEDMLKAGEHSSYTIISSNGKTIPLLSASYDQSTYSATLTFAQTPVSGKYNIQFFSITDNSMEKNPIAADVYTVKIKGRNVILSFIALLFTDYWWILLIVVIAAACLICYNILKKRNGLMFVNGKFSFGDKVKFKARSEKQPPKHTITLDMKDTANITTQLDLSISTSMIFGRSNMCDITLSDAKLSRQHFVLEAIDNCFCISNLSETNGTLLNGIRIIQRRKLQEGDKIFAGQSEFTVRKLQW